LHLADGHSGAITQATLTTALDWCDYLEGHAQRIYSPAADNGLSAAHLILKKRSELADGFSARDIYRHCWAGLSDPDDVDGALELLVEYAHLIELPQTTGGRPTTTYAWRAA